MPIADWLKRVVGERTRAFLIAPSRMRNVPAFAGHGWTGKAQGRAQQQREHCAWSLSLVMRGLDRGSLGLFPLTADVLTAARGTASRRLERKPGRKWA
jgi:hypothetical protein